MQLTAKYDIILYIIYLGGFDMIISNDKSEKLREFLFLPIVVFFIIFSKVFFDFGNHESLTFQSVLQANIYIVIVTTVFCVLNYLITQAEYNRAIKNSRNSEYNFVKIFNSKENFSIYSFEKDALTVYMNLNSYLENEISLVTIARIGKLNLSELLFVHLFHDVDLFLRTIVQINLAYIIINFFSFEKLAYSAVLVITCIAVYYAFTTLVMAVELLAKYHFDKTA